MMQFKGTRVRGVICGSRIAAGLAALGIWFCFTPSALAQVDLAISTDDATTIQGVFIDGNQIAGTDLSGSWVSYINAVSASLPAEVSIDALEWVPGSGLYFSLDSSIEIGGTLFEDEDIIFSKGGTFSKAWDGSDAGIPPEADLNALDIVALSPFEFSFSLDISIELDGLGLVEDEDVVHFLDSAAASGFTGLDFDGSDADIPAGAGVNAFSRLTETEWLISFDVGGEVGGMGFDEGDLLQWNTLTSSFSASPFFDADMEGLEPQVDIVAADGEGLLIESGIAGQDESRSYLRYK